MYVCHNSLYVLSLVLRTFHMNVRLRMSFRRHLGKVLNSNLFNFINIGHQV